MTDREVRVRLAVAGTQQFQQDMNSAAQSAQQLGQQTQQAAQRSESAMSGFAKRAGAAIAGIGFASFISDSISAASDLNETMNKSQVIFGAHADEMTAWASNAASTLGLSKAAALDAASGFGDMFSQIGFTGDQAASMSKTVVQLAADLGSFNNLETDDVLDRISGALRGEYDSLQLVIPNINAARVEQEALAETGKKNAAALTAQEKATATLAIIQKDGARAQGDFANTASGLANSSKIARAEMEDTKAEIGTALLPVMQQLVTLFRDVGVPVISALGKAFGLIGPPLSALVGGVRDLIGFVSGLPGPLQAVGAALAGIAVLKFTGLFAGLRVGLGNVLSPLSSMRMQLAASRELAVANGQRFSAMGTIMRSVGGAAKNMGSALLGAVGGPGGLALVGAIAGVTTVLGFLSDRQREAEQLAQGHAQAVAGLSDALKESNGAINDQVRALVASNLESTKIGDTGKSVLQYGREMGLTVTDLVDAQLGQEAAVKRVFSVMGDYNKAQQSSSGFDLDKAQALRQSNEALIKQLNLLPAAAQLAKEKADNEKAGADAASEAHRENAAAQRDVAGAADEQGQAAARAALAQMDAARESESWNEVSGRLFSSLDAQVAKVEQLAGQLTPMAQAAQDAADAQSQLDQATKEIVTRLDELAGRVPTVEQANSDLFESVSSLADAFGVGTKEAKKLEEGVQAADGSFNLGTESGRQLREQTLGVREAMVTAAKAAYDQAVASGDLKGAQEKANYAARVGYDEFIKTATSILGSKSAAEQAAKAYGLIPGEVTTSIVVRDQEARDKLTAIGVQLAGIANKVVTAFVNVVTQGTQTAAAATSPGPRGARLHGGLIGFAGGGRIPGVPLNPNEDDQIAYTGSGFVRVQSGEYVVNRRQTEKHLPLLKAINSGLMGFAAGGQIPGSGALSGAAERQTGDREGRLLAAFETLRGVVADLADSAVEAARKVREAQEKYRDANSDAVKVAQEQAIKVRDVRVKAASSEAEAEKRLAAARKSGKGLAEAEQKLAAVRSAGNAAVAKAVRSQDLANKAAHERGVQALAELNQAKATSASLNIRVRESQKAYRAETQLRNQQLGLARRYDDYTNRVAATQERLQNLRDQIKDLQNDGRTTALGIRGGILGSSDFKGRITGKDVEAQLKNALAGAQGFDKTVLSAQRLGLSGDLLKTLSSDPDGRSGDVLRALAGADKGTVRRVNSLYATLGRTGAVTGGRIADALGITAQANAAQRQLTSEQAVLSLTESQMKLIGQYMAQSGAAAFKGQTLSVALAGTTFREVAKLEVKANNAAQAARAAVVRR